MFLLIKLILVDIDQRCRSYDEILAKDTDPSVQEQDQDQYFPTRDDFEAQLNASLEDLDIFLATDSLYLDGRPVDLYELAKAVLDHGGYDEVSPTFNKHSLLKSSSPVQGRRRKSLARNRGRSWL